MRRGSAWALLVVSLWLVLSGMTPGGQAWALTVPRLQVDADHISPETADQAFLTGTLSRGKGQQLVLYQKNGKDVLAQQKVGTGKNIAFRLQVPETYLREAAVDSAGNLKVCLQSRPAAGIAASRQIAITVSCVNLRQAQSIDVAGHVTLTNLRTTAKLKAKASSGGKLSYHSSNKKVVSVSKSGKLTRKKNGKATITITQAGGGGYLPVKKKVTVTCRRSNRQEQTDAAVAWAVKIAGDNSFAYGTGRGAHHFGCYFCGTNYGPHKYTKPSARYKKTYCCNPFISAAYAHGARHPKMLAACRRGSGIGMQKWTFYRYGCWKCVGKPAYGKLQKGDVLVKHNHVAMYVGGCKLVEASGGTWSAHSIAVKHMSSARYRSFSYVMRYRGY